MLPALVSLPTGLTAQQLYTAEDPELTFRPVATKAQKYASLVKIDHLKVQRPTAHFRNALKTTEGLERITRQLEKRLHRLERGKCGCEGISFERLSAFRDAFDEVVKLTQTFCPQLKEIKDTYNEHILHMLSQHEDGKLRIPGPPMLPTYTEMEHLTKLRKRIHQLEVESRVLLHENDRLRNELSEEVAFHEEEMDRIHKEGNATVADVLTRPLPPRDYAGRVEELQEEITKKEEGISKEYLNRKGSVPLTVCHNLEQCLREVEIETQKRQRRNKHLREDIQRREQQLLSALQQRHLQLHSDLASVIGLSS